MKKYLKFKNCLSALLITLSMFVLACGSNRQLSKANSKRFITTWKIEKNNEELIIPINSKYKYNYSIDWGDGTIENGITTTGKHKYKKRGVYTVKIWGTFPSISHNPYTYPDVLNNAIKLLTIENWGNINWKDMSYAFSNCRNMKLKATDTPILNDVEDMSYTFAGTYEFNGDLSKWNVSKVKNMRFMFCDTKKFDRDLSNWKVSNVSNMEAMFLHAKAFNNNISTWDVSNVINMRGMFFGADKFNNDISKWNVSGVDTMQQMFYFATNFNSDISNWIVSNVTSMTGMFSYAKSFNKDISHWDVSKVYDMNDMFNNAKSFNRDLSLWNVKLATMNRDFDKEWGGKPSYRPDFNK